MVSPIRHTTDAHRRRGAYSCVAVPIFLLLPFACTSPYDGQGPLEGLASPEFSLEDQNPNSATVGQSLSPSYFRGQVSAWYFGHST